ncbi:MAG: hypothetical protein MI924_09025 [Chloroflexales bacterium]|nr:hypothetical protein [Chloroflexales bacterium]
MGFLDRLFGNKKNTSPQPTMQQGPIRFGSESAATMTSAPAPTYGSKPTLSDEQALQRYRYMLQTAPPETIERAHAEAFAQLTPAQRAQVLQALSAELPPHERQSYNPSHDDPQTMARIATRTEMRQPGSVERILGSVPSRSGGMGGMGMGGLAAGTILGALAAGFVGSMVANAFFEEMGDPFAEEMEGIEEATALAEDPMGAVEENVGDFGDFGGDFGGEEW